MTEERTAFRYVVGAIALIGGLVGLMALYWIEIPTGNRDAVTLALGIVLGWGSSVISGEWGSSPAGRQVASAGAEVMRQAVANPQPQEVRVVNPPSDPANVTEAAPLSDDGLPESLR